MKLLMSFAPAVSSLVPSVRSSVSIVAAGVLAVALSSCGSGSSADNTTKPNTSSAGNGGAGFSYKGEKPAATGDVLKFQNELWINLAPDDRCGGCHSDKGAKQDPMFVRSDDINLAYTAAASVVNLTAPSQSRMVDKVSKGHHCWLKDPVACGDTITTWITKWAGDQGTAANEVVLKAPAVKDIGATKAYPKTPGAFATTVYPVLTQYCSRCHSDSALTRQQPYFASGDIAVAYEAAKTKMRLDSPADSRLVARLRSESHNCWSDCSGNATTMETKIAEFAGTITPIAIDPALVVSKAVGLADAFVLSSGGRVDTNLIAKYEFKSGKGTIAYDTSGIAPSTDLNLIGNVGWSSAWGIKLKDAGRAQATTSSSRKLYDLIMATGEYSVEAWVTPDNVTQGGTDMNPSRIVSYSGSDTVRNFTFGQYKYNYNFLNRTDKSDGNGLAELHTLAAAERVQASLQHVVVTYSPAGGRKIYVNGEYTADMDGSKGAILKDWDANFALVVGNEVTGNVDKTNWSGSIRFVGIHKRAMSEADIKANYKVGVGAKYLLLFNVSDLINITGSYLVFEVQQFDDYGYLFANPFFTNLEGKTVDSDILLKGVRIGVNGEEVATGQVFANLNTTLNASKVVKGRQALSPLGTVVGVKNGPETDQFFITFDQIGTRTYARVPQALTVPGTPAPVPNQPLIGFHTFAEINASLSALTTVPTTNTYVAAAYKKVEQQMPTLPNLDGFLAAQQMGIGQLAIAYCHALVNDSALATAYFQNFSLASAQTFDTTNRNRVIDPLLAHLLVSSAANVSTQPSATTAPSQPGTPKTVRESLNLLIDNMTVSCGGSCSAARTKEVVKATCAGAFGSAAMLLK